jgi:hypothetical protein
MSDFLTTLAQTTLGAATTVQPRLASRFENVASEGVSEVETTHSSRTETPQPAKPVPQFSRQYEEKNTNTQRENSFHPTSPLQVTHEVIRETQSPLLIAPTQARVLPNHLPPRDVEPLGDAKLEHHTVTHELREKETVQHLYSQLVKQCSEKMTETLTKEKLLPVVQQESVRLELPEMPILQPPPTPALFKPETSAVQTQRAVQVTIGRLEIRTPPQQKTVQQSKKVTGVMSLEEYRSKRGLS